MNVTKGGCMSTTPFIHQAQLRGPYIIAELLIALLAIVGNALVCLAVGRNRRLRTVTNYFLVSLSVADILVGLLAIPCAVLTDLGRPHHDLPLCLVLLSVLMVLTQSSILSLLAVAVERYLAILRPFQYQRVMSPRNARLALLLTWGVALLSGSVPLMDWHKQPPDAPYCLFTCVVDMTYMVYFNFFGCLLVPLFFMFLIYGRIFHTVRRQLRRIAVARGAAAAEDSRTATFAAIATVPENSPTASTAPEDSPAASTAPEDSPNAAVAAAAGTERSERIPEPRSVTEPGARAGAQALEGPPTTGAPTTPSQPVIETKTSAVFRTPGVPSSGSDDDPHSGPGAKPSAQRTRLELHKATSLFLVLFLFMVCWMPLHFINCVVLLCPQCPVPMPATMAAILLSHANSALNPILYAYRMRSFRHTLQGMCLWRGIHGKTTRGQWHLQDTH